MSSLLELAQECYSKGTNFDDTYNEVLLKNLKEDDLTCRMNPPEVKNLVESVFYPKADDDIIKMSDIKSTITKWLWKPYIPQGKVTLIVADPGVGKTYFACYLMAMVSSGQSFYGANMERNKGTVIFQTAEDGLADTIKPRLEEFENTIYENVLIINEEYESLNLMSEKIEDKINKYRPQLVIFDPLQAYLGAEVDMYRANEVRPIMAHIVRLAEKYNCAIVFIMHSPKQAQTKAIYKTLGTIDIPAAARSMLYILSDPNNPDDKILCHEKFSLSKRGKSIIFNIEPGYGGIVFKGYSDLCADDLLDIKKNTRDKPSVKRNEAENLIYEMLGENGYCKCKDIEAAAYLQGISKDTLSRAKNNLYIKHIKKGFSDESVTWWYYNDINPEKIDEEMSKNTVS